MRELIKKVLKSNQLGKLIYNPLHNVWRMYNEPRRRRRLQKYGVETLEILHGFFKTNNIEYYLDFGTLLGVVRENGFIKHDDDIDLTIRKSELKPKEIIESLINTGFNFVHGFYANDKVLEFTVERYGLTVDIFIADFNSKRPDDYVIYGCYYDPNVKYPSGNANNYRSWSFSKDLTPIEINFKGVKVCIPNVSERLLEAEYGSTWRTPIKNFVEDKEALNIEIQEDFAYRVTDVNNLP